MNEINIYEYPTNLEDLPRYRIAVMTAHDIEGKECKFQFKGGTLWFPKDGEWEWDWVRKDYRIVRPKLAKGHNPDGLTEEQVGVKEMRTLSPEENAYLWNHPAKPGELEWWNNYRGHWEDNAVGGDNCTYRTRKPAGYFLPKVEKVETDNEAIEWIWSGTYPSNGNRAPYDFGQALLAWERERVAREKGKSS